MNENQAIPDGLMSKLQKLKNLKEGAEAVGSTHEAENAAAMLTKLLLLHNLEMEDVEKAGIEAKVKMADVEYDLDEKQAKTEAGWLEILVHAVAHHCMCKVLKKAKMFNSHAYDQGRLIIIGDKTNVATVFYIVEQLIVKIDIACKGAWKQYDGDEKRNTFRRGFLRGAVAAIKRRLWLQEEEMKEEINMSSGKVPHSMAMVLANKRQEAEDYMMTKFKPRTVKTRASSLSGYGGYVEGMKAGEKMDIHRGVGGNKETNKLN